MVSLIPCPQRLFHSLPPSPVALLAPTPANTPLIPNSSTGGDVMEVGGDGQNCNNSQASDGGLKQQEVVDACESLTTRALLFDSPGKSETCVSCSSVVTTPGSSCCCKEKSLERDNGCVWSIQVPKSLEGEEDDGEDDEEEENDYGDPYGDAEEGEEIEELCEGLRKICVEEKKEMPKFEGRHTRFIYNSDDEMEGEEEDVEAKGGCSVSPSILRLKGMPTPAGKHLRFSANAEEEEI